MDIHVEENGRRGRDSAFAAHSVRPTDATSTSSSTLVNIDGDDRPLKASLQKRQTSASSPYARFSPPKTRRRERIPDAPPSPSSSSSTTTRRAPGREHTPVADLPLCPDDCRCSDQEIERGFCRRAMAEASSEGGTSEADSEMEARLLDRRWTSAREQRGDVRLAWDPSERRRDREAKQQLGESRSSSSTITGNQGSASTPLAPQSQPQSPSRTGDRGAGRDLRSDPVVVPRSSLDLSATNSSDEGDEFAPLQTYRTRSSPLQRSQRPSLRVSSSPGPRPHQELSESTVSALGHGSAARRSIANVFERLLQEEQRRRQEDKEKKEAQRERRRQEKARREGEHESDWDDNAARSSLRGSQRAGGRSAGETSRSSPASRLQHDVDRLQKLSAQTSTSASSDTSDAHKGPSLLSSPKKSLSSSPVQRPPSSAIRFTSQTPIIQSIEERREDKEPERDVQLTSTASIMPPPPPFRDPLGGPSASTTQLPGASLPDAPSSSPLTTFAFPNRLPQRQAPLQAGVALIDSSKQLSPLVGSGRFSPGDPSSPRRNSHRRSADVDVVSVSRRLPTTSTTPPATPTLPSALAEVHTPHLTPAGDAFQPSTSTSPRRVRFSPQPPEVVVAEREDDTDETPSPESHRDLTLQDVEEEEENEEDQKGTDMDRSFAAPMEPTIDLGSGAPNSTDATRLLREGNTPKTQSPFVPGAYFSPAAGALSSAASPNFSRHIIRPRGPKNALETVASSRVASKEKNGEEEDEEAFWKKETGPPAGVSSPPRPFAWTSALSRFGSAVYSPPKSKTSGLENKADTSMAASLGSASIMEDVLEESLEEDTGGEDDEITQGSQYHGGAPRESTPPPMSTSLRSSLRSNLSVAGRQMKDMQEQSLLQLDPLRTSVRDSSQIPNADDSLRLTLEELLEVLKRPQEPDSFVSSLTEITPPGNMVLSSSTQATDESGRALGLAEIADESLHRSKVAEEEDRRFVARLDQVRDRLQALLHSSSISGPQSKNRTTMWSTYLRLMLHLAILFVVLQFAKLRASLLYHHPYSLLEDPFQASSTHSALLFSILPRRLPLWSLMRGGTDGLLARLNIFPPGYLVGVEQDGLAWIQDLPISMQLDGGQGSSSVAKVVFDIVWRNVKSGRTELAWRVLMWNLARSIGWDWSDVGEGGLLVPT